VIGFGAGEYDLLHDAWDLRLSGEPVWEPIPLPQYNPAFNTTPYNLTEAAACYDDAGRQMLVIDGAWTYGDPIGMVWRVDLTDRPRWSVLKTQGALPARYEHAATMDAPRRRVLVFGGLARQVEGGAFPANDLWELSLGGSPTADPSFSTAAAATPRLIAFAFRGAQPNPTSGPLNLSFDLPTASETRVRLYDVAGRVVVDEALGRLGPGTYSRSVASAAHLAPGMYVVRLTHGADEAMRRVVVVR
jgi:hypothetical protein